MNPPTMAMNIPVKRYCMAMILWSVDQMYFRIP